MSVIFQLNEQILNNLDLLYPMTSDTQSSKLLIKSYGFINPRQGINIHNMIGFVNNTHVVEFENINQTVATFTLSSITTMNSAVGLKVYQNGINTATPGIDFDLGVANNYQSDEVDVDVYRHNGSSMSTGQFANFNINIYPTFDKTKKIISYIHKADAGIDYVDTENSIIIIRKFDFIPLSEYKNTYIRTKLEVAKKKYLLQSFVDQKFNDNEFEFYCNNNVLTYYPRPNP